MTSQDPSPPSYWYSENRDDMRGARVMEALRSYRAAEMTMRRRTQQSMAMGENELLVLRFLTRAASAQRDVTPIDLARHLDVSTASVTALLDRLERSGHLMRRPHPADRRKVLVTTTPHANDEMREVLTAMHARMMQATRGMTESEADAVTAFLRRMRCAVADVCADAGDRCCSIVEAAAAASDIESAPQIACPDAA